MGELGDEGVPRILDVLSMRLTTFARQSTSRVKFTTVRCWQVGRHIELPEGGGEAGREFPCPNRC
jgi:hypothetical protein